MIKPPRRYENEVGAGKTDAGRAGELTQSKQVVNTTKISHTSSKENEDQKAAEFGTKIAAEAGREQQSQIKIVDMETEQPQQTKQLPPEGQTAEVPKIRDNEAKVQSEQAKQLDQEGEDECPEELAANSHRIATQRESVAKRRAQFRAWEEAMDERLHRVEENLSTE